MIGNLLLGFLLVSAILCPKSFAFADFFLLRFDLSSDLRKFRSVWSWSVQNRGRIVNEGHFLFPAFREETIK